MPFDCEYKLASKSVMIIALAITVCEKLIFHFFYLQSGSHGYGEEKVLK